MRTLGKHALLLAEVRTMGGSFSGMVLTLCLTFSTVNGQGIENKRLIEKRCNAYVQVILMPLVLQG